MFSFRRFRIEHHKRISSRFRDGLTFAQCKERVRADIVQDMQSVIYISEAVFLARANHIAGEYVVELHVQHILCNVFKKLRGVFVRAFERSETRDFFRKHKLSFKDSVFPFKTRHRGVAPDHTRHERFIVNRRRIHLVEITFGSGVFYIRVAFLHEFFHVRKVFVRRSAAVIAYTPTGYCNFRIFLSLHVFFYFFTRVAEI